MNICSRCSNLLTSNVETTTDDLLYNVKLDKDTMAYYDSEQVFLYPKPIESIIEEAYKNEFKANDSYSSSLLPLINSNIPVMPTGNQEVEESITSQYSTDYYRMPSSINAHTATPFELVKSAKIIAENIRKFVSLEILYFSNNDLKDEGLYYILEAIADRSLLKFFIIDNNITDVSAMRIAKLLTESPQVMSLINLDKNLMAAKGVKSIIQVLPRDKKLGLKTWSVCGNTLINDECIDDIINILEENRSIKCLYLDKCNLSKDGKNRLQQVANEKSHFCFTRCFTDE
ncbi:unnamed protein product [Rotaria sp. Silwood1]|nr:unnamed protein product [Rotaria sp. Silwood1]